MSWGVGFFYYTCPACKKKFKYAQDLMTYFGEDFGLCPYCKEKGERVMGTYVKDGPRGTDDLEYYEVEE